MDVGVGDWVVLGSGAGVPSAHDHDIWKVPLSSD